MEKGALISQCGAFRSVLWRELPQGPEGHRIGQVNFIMLNPSTADAHDDDATIRRCVNFARAWGARWLYVTNLYSYRATSPRSLRAAAYPIGPDNDRAILQQAATADLIVCAWGNNAQAWRARAVVSLLTARKHPLWCLGTTKRQAPRHPLYLPKTATLERLA